MTNTRQMRTTDPCICASGKQWKQCCGAYIPDTHFHYKYQRVAGEGSVRFILLNGKTGQTQTDDTGAILVFTNRAQAIALNARLQDLHYQVVGLTKSGWAQFQLAYPEHVVISDAVA